MESATRQRKHNRPRNGIVLYVLEIAGVFDFHITTLLVELRNAIEKVDTLLCVRCNRIMLIL